MVHGSFVVILPDGVVISGFGFVVVSFGVGVEKTVSRNTQYKDVCQVTSQ